MDQHLKFSLLATAILAIQSRVHVSKTTIRKHALSSVFEIGKLFHRKRCCFRFRRSRDATCSAFPRTHHYSVRKKYSYAKGAPLFQTVCCLSAFEKKRKPSLGDCVLIPFEKRAEAVSCSYRKETVFEIRKRRNAVLACVIMVVYVQPKNWVAARSDK